MNVLWHNSTMEHRVMIFKRVSKIYIPIYLNFPDEAKYIRNESILLFKGDKRRQKEDMVKQ